MIYRAQPLTREFHKQVVLLIGSAGTLLVVIDRIPVNYLNKKCSNLTNSNSEVTSSNNWLRISSSIVS